MLVRLDILDDRLEEGDGDARGRLRDYLDLWRAGAIAPLSDPDAVLIVELGDGSRALVANDGLGEVDHASGSRQADPVRREARH